jgi:hypothetical protein
MSMSVDSLWSYISTSQQKVEKTSWYVLMLAIVLVNCGQKPSADALFSTTYNTLLFMPSPSTSSQPDRDFWALLS